MAEPLKNIYNKIFIDELTFALKKAYPSFDANRFTKNVFSSNWAEKELKDRMRHIAESMRPLLPDDFSSAASVLLNCIQHLKLTRDSEMNYEFMFFPEFVERFGINDLDTSINTLEKMTQFTSAEFAVRPFLLRYPEKMQKQMLQWSKHPHAMVRRLSSEGIRPRLPWAMAIPYLKKEPSVILPILENLKNDESESVRRSVANNLNDIAKDHPSVLLDVLKRWKGQSNEVDWVLKHGSRYLLKNGHSKALGYFGIKEIKGLECSTIKIAPSKLSIGESFEFSFSVSIKKATKLRIEYAIDFVKANGKTSRKIFKLSEGNYNAGKTDFTKKHSFKDLTTRKHYPGKHAIAIIVNGVEQTKNKFELK